MPTPAVSFHEARGFSTLEILGAFLIAILVMTSGFLLLTKSQESFARGPEVVDGNPGARAALDRISRDLAVAGFATPSSHAVLWSDGGGFTPDGITIVYADPEVPVSRPRPCPASAPCPTLGTSTVVSVDPFSVSPQPPDYSEAYREGMVLFAIQGPNGEPACDKLTPGLASVRLEAAPTCTGGASKGPKACGTLNLTVGPAPSPSDLNLPAGFDTDVSLQCAVLGLFHVVQYRVDSLQPSEGRQLLRRDVTLGDPWTSVAGPVENLQVQYAQGASEAFEDAPSLMPVGSDPSSWVTRVRITVGGRSERTNLEGATRGVYASEPAPLLRRVFTTTVRLRNQLRGRPKNEPERGLSSGN